MAIRGVVSECGWSSGWGRAAGRIGESLEPFCLVGAEVVSSRELLSLSVSAKQS